MGRQRTGAIRVGIGGWAYEPWRETFYPPGLPQRLALHHASRQLTAIEINSTFYRAPAPGTYRKWRADTPEGFVFSVKAPRYVTHRKQLAEAGEAARRFIDGALHLEDRLGPLLWQLPPPRTFNAGVLGPFLDALPAEAGGRPLRHVLEVRHESFLCEAYVALARAHGVATVCTDSPRYPNLADITGPFVYARLMNARPDLASGYPDEALDRWADRARAWSAGARPEGLPCVSATPAPVQARDVYVFFIDGAKERAPAAARGLIERLVR